MAIEIVDFPIQNGEFPYHYVSLPEGIPGLSKNFPSLEDSEQPFPHLGQILRCQRRSWQQQNLGRVTPWWIGRKKC